MDDVILTCSDLIMSHSTFFAGLASVVVLMPVGCQLISGASDIPFADGAGAGTSVGGNGAGGGGGGGTIECLQDEDCPGLSDDCKVKRCKSNLCGFDFGTEGNYCQGETGVCNGLGACVECTPASTKVCEVTETCDTNVCVTAGCINETTDGNETDLDCGGDCAGCANGEGCNDGSDCASGHCDTSGGGVGNGAGVCAGCTIDADCVDIPDSYCGGMICVAKKRLGDQCVAANECLSGSCADGTCCSTSCTQGCHACAFAITGAASGTCAPVPDLATEPGCTTLSACCNGACKVLTLGSC
jgi:hypothetical protein